MTSQPQTPARPAASRESLGLLLGLLGVIIFGGTLPATREALVSFSPWFITHGRAVLASSLALILLAALRKPLPRADLGPLLLAGLLLVFGFPVMSSLAMKTVPAAHGGVVLGFLPLATALFSALLGGERPSALFWLCGVSGAAVVVVFAVRDSGMTLTACDLWLFLAGLSASLGYVISGRLARRMPGWEVICWALVLTLPLSLPGAVWSYRAEFATASASALLAFVYLGVGSMFLGFFAWNMGLAMGGIARVSQVQLLQSFVTLGISALVLGERITHETLGFALIVVAIVAAGRKARIAA